MLRYKVGSGSLLVAIAFLVPCALAAQEGNRAVVVRPANGLPRAEETRIALVIGNSAYADAPLRNPVHDARAMHEALGTCKFQVTLLTDASKRAMEDAIRAFGERLQGGAVGLFYFAGHGLQVQGSNYLIPIGARLDKETDVVYEGVDVGRVLDNMQAAGNKLNILVLDACRNNPFALAKGWRSAGEKGLAQVKAPTGTLVAYATAPGSVAADGTGEHGLYTGSLLMELKEPGVSLLQTFQKVREQVLDGSKGGQTPWESNSTVGNFYFRPQRTAEEIAREQGAVQAETKRLEDELKAQEAQAQTMEVQRQAEALKGQLRAQALERQRLAQEADRRREIDAETTRAKADAARRQEEAGRLETLKQQLAGRREPGQGGPGVTTLEGARQELTRLTQQREDLLKPIQAQKTQALAKLDEDYAGLRRRLEAPRDEFETKDQYESRRREAGELQAKMTKERETVEGEYAAVSNVQTKPLDERANALKGQKYPVSYPVELGAYDPDQGRFSVRIPLGGYRSVRGLLVLEPGKARELKARRELLTAQGDASLASGPGLPERLVDPVWGALALEAAQIDQITVDLGRGVQLNLVGIPAGKFQMGEAGDAHEVTISQAFALGKFAVTQAQWVAVMGSNPSSFKGPDLPVESVSWDDCQQFILRMNAKGEGTYRLPTEAEWEYACRAGTTGERYGDLGAIAWYADNSGQTTHPVGQKQPNAWGLYDMNGNVWQWCQDWYGDYPGGSVTDPQGASSGSIRVLRGGCWFFDASYVRSAYRLYYVPGARRLDLGFRLLRTLP